MVAKVETGTFYIQPGSPWENGYCEGFNGKLRDECLNGEISYSLREARIVIETWNTTHGNRTRLSAIGRGRRCRSRAKARLCGRLRLPAIRHVHPCPIRL